MSSRTTPSAEVNEPRISAASGAIALAALPGVFLVAAWFLYHWSHSALLGISVTLAAVVMGVGMWMSLQTRITSRGVSGFNTSGLKLPRRVHLSWQEVGRIDVSEHAAKVCGAGTSINIPLTLFPDRTALAAFIAIHMDQAAANRAGAGD